MSRFEGRFRMVPVAVGVDFGTTNSAVAIADRSGQVHGQHKHTGASVNNPNERMPWERPALRLVSLQG